MAVVAGKLCTSVYRIHVAAQTSLIFEDRLASPKSTLKRSVNFASVDSECLLDHKFRKCDQDWGNGLLYELLGLKGSLADLAAGSRCTRDLYRPLLVT